MFMAIGAAIAGVFGAAATSALAVGIGSVLTAAGAMYSAKTMFEGIEEGDVGKAILGGIGAFTGVSSLMSAASTVATSATTTVGEQAMNSASEFSDLTNSDLMLDSGYAFNGPEVNDLGILNTPNDSLVTDSLNSLTQPVSNTPSVLDSTSTLLDSSSLSPSTSEALSTMSDVGPLDKMLSNVGGSIKGGLDRLTSVFDSNPATEGSLSSLSKLGTADNILNSKGLGYTLQYLGSRRQQEMLEDMKKQELADYNRRVANLGHYVPASEYTR